jgi:hypothetical protein
MIDVYFPNGVFLLLASAEALFAHRANWKSGSWSAQKKLILSETAFVAAIIVALMPTLITRWIVYGGLLRFGSYTREAWDWSAPHWRQILFSPDHGAISWTPILALAIVGLFLAIRRARTIAIYVSLAAAMFYYIVASYPYWDGLASYGNRFLISLTCVFVFGLGLFFERCGKYFRDGGRAFVAAAGIVALLTVWNAGFIYQWGEHLIPVRGEISFREMIHNQMFVVPREIGTHLRGYLFRRKSEMHSIEQRDLQQLEEHPQQ